MLEQLEDPMSKTGQPGRQWALRLQSALVLPLARGIYLVVALLCLLAVTAGALYLVYLQTSIASEPKMLPVPPPYEGDGVSAPHSDRVVDLARVGARLDPPANIRFSVTAGPMTEPPREGAIVGRFVADTPNGLAPFPDGVSLLGGRDAELFERVGDGRDRVVALAARPALVTEITQSLKDLTGQTRRSFEVRVVARDAYGSVSPPTDLSFDLVLAAKRATSEAPPPAAPQPDVTELQKIAREIAQIIEPEVNPAHFTAYKTALAVPERCGSSGADDTFVANYRRALDAMRPRLTAENVEAFYSGLCDAWREILKGEDAALKKLRAKEMAAREAAENARRQAQARNNEMLRDHEIKVLSAKAQSSVVLSVIGGALALFLSVALVLAFLAIEGHSRAVRAAMESLVRISQEGRVHASSIENP